MAKPWHNIDKKRQAYRDQKGAANKRGIDWEFTYEEWVDWWGDDFEKRGVGSNKLVMARFNDSGPYNPNNVKKITFGDNSRERNMLNPTPIMTMWEKA